MLSFSSQKKKQKKKQPKKQTKKKKQKKKKQKKKTKKKHVLSVFIRHASQWAPTLMFI